MKIKEFKLERYFARYEFKARYLLCCSDCEALALNELLDMADKETLDMWGSLKLGYTESQGHPVLRHEISLLYNDIYPSELLVATPEEAIFITMNTVLAPEDHVIVTFPGYQSLFEIAASIGCSVSGWEPDYNKNGFDFDTEKLKTLIHKNTKMIVMNFPHNPTGCHISQDQAEEIVSLADKQNIFIFSDEMYRYLEHDKNKKVKPLCEFYENGISLCGMSKSFSLPGLRIGWLASKNKAFYKKVCEFKDYTTICSSAPSEILAVIGLRNRKTITRNNLQLIKKNLDLLDSFFDRYSFIFDWHRPCAGPIAFPRLKIDQPASAFCRKVLEKEDVLLLPADLYDFSSNNFRIGFGRKNMPESLSRLEAYVKTI